MSGSLLDSLGPHLGGLPHLKTGRARQASSYDRAGGNKDFISLEPGETATLASCDQAGTIARIWVTVNNIITVNFQDNSHVTGTRMLRTNIKSHYSIINFFYLKTRKNFFILWIYLAAHFYLPLILKSFLSGGMSAQSSGNNNRLLSG